MHKIYLHTNLFLLGLSLASVPATLASINTELKTLYLCIVLFTTLTLLTWLILYFVAMYKLEDEQMRLDIIKKLGFYNNNFSLIICFLIGFIFSLITFKLI